MTKPNSQTKWKDEYYVLAHQLAASGESDENIAGIIGVSYPTFRRWKLKRPALVEALEAARSQDRTRTLANATGDVVSFTEYIYEQLPENLQDLYDQIMRFEEEKLGRNKIEALLERHGKRARQWLFIHAWVTSHFRLSVALKRLNVSRRMFDHWCEEADFQELVSEIEWHKDNFFEETFVTLVACGDTSATIHAAKTRLRERGYSEKHEVNISGEIEGGTNINIEELNLTLPEKLRLLEAMRAQTGGPVVPGQVLNGQ